MKTPYSTLGLGTGCHHQHVLELSHFDFRSDQQAGAQKTLALRSGSKQLQYHVRRLLQFQVRYLEEGHDLVFPNAGLFTSQTGRYTHSSYCCLVGGYQSLEKKRTASFCREEGP